MAALTDLGLKAWEGWERSRRQLWIVALSVVSLVGLIYGVSLWRYWGSHVTTDDARIQTHVTPVSSRIPATVIDVLVKDNQEVKAGEILVLLDPRDYDVKFQQAWAAVQIAKGNLEKAAADLRVTDESTESLVRQAEAALGVTNLGTEVAAHSLEERQSGLKASEAAVGAAKAAVAAAEAAFQQANLDRDRMGKLLGEKIIAQQEYDHAEAAFKTTEARLVGAQKRLQEAEAQALQAAAGVRNQKAVLEQSGERTKESEAILTNVRSQRGQVKLRQAELQAARGRLEEALANLRQAELNLGYTTIQAPDAGRVTMKKVEVGQVLQPGQALLAIVKSGDVWVVANYKETQLTHVKPGQGATFTVDAYPGVVFKARVDSIQAGTGAEFALLPPENATGNFVKVVQRVPVKLVLEPGQTRDHTLIPGMSVVATIETSIRNDDPERSPMTDR